MPAADYIQIAGALQYTGSNGAEMSAYVGVPILSESSGVLTLGDPVHNTVSYVFQTGDWWDRAYNAWWPASDFPGAHITKAAALQDTDTVFNPAGLQSQITANTNNIATNTTAITALQTKLGKADIVSISVPILILGGTADRPITWNRPFSNANYDLSYAFDASTIGRITCAPVAGTKTATGITIRITAGLAVSVLGVVHVFGIGV